MGNLVIATPELSDAAAITASSAQATMPASNLKKMQPGDRWRATGDTAEYLEIDLGAAKDINLVALLYHNATSAATWQIRAATSQANLTAAPGYDSGVINMWEAGWPADQDPLHARLWLGAGSQNFRWWRIDLADAANPDTWLEAGRVYVSKAWQLPSGKNIEYGWEMRRVDPSPRARTKGSQLYVEAQTMWRELMCSLNWLTEAEMYDNFGEIQRLRGASRDVFVMRDPNATAQLLRQSIYGLMSQLAPITHAQAQVFRSRLLVEEMLA